MRCFTSATRTVASIPYLPSTSIARIYQHSLNLTSRNLRERCGAAVEVLATRGANGRRRTTAAGELPGLPVCSAPPWGCGRFSTDLFSDVLS
jgi:hypothetical protein